MHARSIIILSRAGEKKLPARVKSPARASVIHPLHHARALAMGYVNYTCLCIIIIPLTGDHQLTRENPRADFPPREPPPVLAICSLTEDRAAALRFLCGARCSLRFFENENSLWLIEFQGGTTTTGIHPTGAIGDRVHERFWLHRSFCLQTDGAGCYCCSRVLLCARVWAILRETYWFVSVVYPDEDFRLAR